MPSTRFLHEWPFTRDSFVLSHLHWKRPAEQSFKGTSLESTNKNVGHFPSHDIDRFWIRLGRSFFQLRWPWTIESRVNGHSCKNLVLGIWPIPVKKSGDFINIDFWLDFARNYSHSRLVIFWTRDFKKEVIRKRLESCE